MFDSKMKKAALPLAVITAMALVSGCSWAKRDSVIVGSVPDDYRTRHPIVIAEGEEILDLPIGTSAYRMTGHQKAAIAGFLDKYGDSGQSLVTILVPAGSLNEAAALSVSGDFAEYLRRAGVPGERIQVLSYQAGPEETAPIRLSYGLVKAQVGPCGRWPDDIAESYENRNWENFGCAYQNNLAAQVANPNDFLGPRKMTPIDAENRDAAITDYKDRKISETFRSHSEVDYDQ
ncbi:CpaD family pilus assembly protein [Nitratireductor luteus]|uniref:CpaD family pilus assembly protein n=1 Tax=Nitratireductor luteus TaxID=2976980 RepID=UPI00223FE045|nr:CpaD family pilus assembly lipoprotein [Nitratireductor luteus]